MKRCFLFIVFAVFSLHSSAQPVIENGNNLPTVGFTAPVSVATMSIANVGASGADQVWDFSGLTYTSAGTMEYIDPSSSPFGSSFPLATHAFSFAGTYTFLNNTASQQEALAFTISSPGSGNDYTPNPKTLLKFPFNYTESLTDGWQQVGDSPNSVTQTYDAYGTLITPTHTYTNVVRIHSDYGPEDDDYQWYTLDPLTFVAIFDNDINALYSIAGAQNTDISEQNSLGDLLLYPNPANDQLTLSGIALGSNIQVFDMTGRILQNIAKGNTRLNIANLSEGMYLVYVENNGLTVTKKFTVSR